MDIYVIKELMNVNDVLLKADSEMPIKDAHYPFINKLKGYAEAHTAIFIFLTTAAVSALSYFFRALNYIFQLGYNSFFNIPDVYIKISDNYFYDFFVYAAIGIIVSLSNYYSYIQLKKRAFIMYLSVLSIILSVFNFLINLLGPIGFFYYGDNSVLANIIPSFFIFFILAFSLHINVISFVRDIPVLTARLINKVNWTSTKLKIFQKISSRKMPLISILFCLLAENCQQKVRKYEHQLSTLTNSQPPKATTSDSHKVKSATQYLPLFLVLIIPALLCYYYGYFTASSTKHIKTIPNNCVGTTINETVENVLGNKAYNYAVLTENEKVYLLCPYKEPESGEIELISALQVEVDKANIVVIEQSFNKVGIFHT